MARKTLTLLTQHCRPPKFGDRERPAITNPDRRQLALLNEGLKMKTRYHRAPPRRPVVRHLHLAAAIVRYREWDAAMIRQHGPLYYRAMGYSLH